MGKIFFVMNELSKYFKKIDSKEFEKALDDLNPMQNVGISLLICIADLFNKSFLETGKDIQKDLKNERYIMGSFTERIRKSDLESAKKMENCVKEMKLESIYEKTREDFLTIFKKESNDIIPFKNFEEKKLTYKTNITYNEISFLKILMR